MLDFNHRLKPGDVSAAINAVLDAAIDARPEMPRGYLGGSSLGDACDRRLQHLAMGLPFDAQALPRTRRIWRRGHLLEAYAAEELEAAGFVVVRQAEFRRVGGRLQGHADGVIREAPLAMRLPALWEHKALGTKTWRSVVGKGVAVATPYYAAQVAVYQAYLEADFPGIAAAPALFSVTNADTMERYHELIAFDRALAQEASDRAAKVLRAVDAGELLPRVAASAGHWECKGCAFRGRCWTET